MSNRPINVFVAANGGHLAQLVELAARMEEARDDDLWVTFDSAQGRSLLAGRRHVFVDEIGERDVAGVIGGVATAHRLLARQPVRAVISTGSGIALSFLPYAALRGIPAHYIESAARVHAPSLTGRVLQRIPRVHLYRQYPVRPVGRWKYAGSVFDGFEPTEHRGRPVRRVVVTVGGSGRGFDRLLMRLRAILPAGIDVLWQTGTAGPGMPQGSRPTVPAAELANAIAAADVVIGHAGCGSALTALNSGKFPLLVPRERAHGELIDSHQAELASYLSHRDLALHRTPDSITFDDVIAAAGRGIRRLAKPPVFRLEALP